MRRTACFLVVVAFLAVHTGCQNLPRSTTESDDDLNLDPDVESNSDVTPRAETEIKVAECKTDSGEDGVCVSYYLCDESKRMVIEDGYTLIDIRAGSSCANFLEVCCQRPKAVTTPPPSLPAEDFAQKPRQTPKVNSSNSVNPNQHTESPAVLTSSVSQVTVVKCGYSNPGANLLSVVRDGGSIDDRYYADFGEFPWMVAILRRTNQPDTEEWQQDDYIGGGSLIHPSVVITVAHKVAGWKPNQIIIRAGEYDTNSISESFEHQDRNVAKIILHENFGKSRAHNDVGLLILETPVIVKDPNIGIGCLSPQAPMPGTTCFSMGWGNSDFHNKNVFAAILKKVKVPIVESTRCEKILRKTRLGARFTLHPSLMCAGGQKNVDTCRGDGGSSLVCPTDPKGSRFAIYGMVAYGISCGLDGVPGVYVNGANIYEWVGQQFKKEGLDTQSYIHT